MKRIPAEPLIRYIENRGGLAEVLLNAGIEIYLPDTEEDPRPNLTYLRYFRTLDRSEKRGWFGLFWADDFIVTVFGTHPVSVYGDWYELGDDEKLQEALALPVPEAVAA